MELLVALVKFFDSHQTTSGVALVLFAVMIAGPYVLMYRLERIIRDQKRMYENNVELARQALKLAEDNQSLVIMNVTAMTQVKEKVEDCPRGGIPR